MKSAVQDRLSDDNVTENIIITEHRPTVLTPDMHESKTLITNDERGSKIARNSVFEWHLSPDGRQMAVEISVSS